MNLGNFTIKAAEAFQQAQQLAFNAQSPNIETEHLLKALLEQEDSPVEYLLKKNNVTLNLLQTKLEDC
jgi:ATP-dependent Clp protease ATP-binding subunit ClpB